VAAQDDLRAVVVTVVDSTAGGRRESIGGPPHRGGPAVIAGGSAIPDAATARSIGADDWGADPRDLGRLIATVPRVIRQSDRHRAGASGTSDVHCDD
jgi:hypothetical protein